MSAANRDAGGRERFSHSKSDYSHEVDVEMRATCHIRGTEASTQVHSGDEMDTIITATSGSLESLESNLSFPNVHASRNTDEYKILEKKLIEKGFNDKMMVVRRLSRIRDLRLYVDNSLLQVDLNDWGEYKVIAMMAFYPILITFIVILVPLGGFQRIDQNDNTQINTVGYLVFQAVYALLAYNCMVRLFSEAYVGVVPDLILWYVMPFGFGTAVILTLYSCLLFLDYPGKQPEGNKPTAIGGIYAYAIWYQFVYIWCIYLYYILLDKYKFLQPVDSKSKLLENDASSLSHVIGTSTATVTDLDSLRASDGGTKRISDGSATFATFDSINTSKTLSHSDQVDSDKNGITNRDGNYDFSKLGSPLLSLYPSVLCLSLAIAGLYSFCAWFTGFFETATAAAAYGNNTSLILLFIFVFVVCAGTMVVIGLGNIVDQGLAPDCPSLNVIVGMMADTYLIVYYRNLFAYVDGWGAFLEFSLVAIISELVTFQYSVTDSYKNLHNDIIAYGVRKLQETDKSTAYLESFKITCAYLYCSTHGWRDGEIFVNKNSLMLGYRFILRFSTSVSYIIFQIFLRYGYNSPFYSVDKNHYSDKRFNQLLAFIALSFVFECIVMYFPDKALRERTNIGILARTISFFQKAKNSTPYVFFFIWALGHINSDVFVAKIDYAHQGRLL